MDMVTLATLTMLLVCCACTFYLLSCVWRILAALWCGFCAFANAADRAICYFTGDVPYEDAASWLETWRVKHEARRHAKPFLTCTYLKMTPASNPARRLSNSKRLSPL